MILEKLSKAKLIHPPDWLISNCHYLTVMGSYAYGVNNDRSDEDIYGFCIPPKNIVFPHLSGEIYGFGRQTKRFDQWQEHHIKYEVKTKEAYCPQCGVDITKNKVANGVGNLTYITYVCDHCKKEHYGNECVSQLRNYDFSVYNIVKYFQLCMDNNPNMIDSLFTDHTSVIHCTAIGNIVRDNRRLFLHKGAKYKFSGYAYSQLEKIEYKEHHDILRCVECDLEVGKVKTGEPCDETYPCKNCGHDMLAKRIVSAREKYLTKTGYDTKFAYHLVRLMDEGEQILSEGDLDLRRNAEKLKSIRRGEWTLEQIKEYFVAKQKVFEELYISSKLQHRPDEDKIKAVLLNCLEHHYGSIDNCVAILNKEQLAVQEIKAILEKYKC